MEKLSKDELYVLGLQMDGKSILELSKVNKNFNEKINKNEEFWRDKLRKDYPLLEKFLENTEWKIFYLEMLYYIDKMEKEFEIPYIPTKGYNPKKIYEDNYDHRKDYVLNRALYEAALGGHLDIVKYLVGKGAKQFNSAMIDAGTGGHLHIIDYLIEKGAKNFDGAMWGAAVEGHLNIVKYMVEKGARNFNDTMVNTEKNNETYIYLMQCKNLFKND